MKNGAEHVAKIHNLGVMRSQVKVELVNNKPFFDAGTMKLLKLIDSLGSVKEACDKAGISYSKGWSMIHLAEKELGYEIVERKQGGRSGGQAMVTQRGFELLRTFGNYEAEVTNEAELLYKKFFEGNGA